MTTTEQNADRQSATVIDLLRELAERVPELIRYDEAYNEWYLTRGGETIFSTMTTKSGKLLDTKNIFEDLLLGALCAWCEERGWRYLMRWNPPVGFEVMVNHQYGQSEEGFLTAALLAVLEAVKGEAACPECGFTDSHYPSCSKYSPDKVIEKVLEEQMTFDREMDDLAEHPLEVTCKKGNGTGKVEVE